MKTIIIGGGHGCKDILTLSRRAFLKELDLETVAVVDKDDNAPGLVYAREQGIPTYNSWELAASEIEYELIIELTGSDELLVDLYKRIQPGIRLIDHKMAHIFWDLINAQEEKEKQFKEVKKLEEQLQQEKEFLQHIFDGLTDLAVVIDSNREIIRANKNFYEFTGKSEGSVVGKPCCSLLANSSLCDQNDVFLDFYSNAHKGDGPITNILITDTPDETHWEVTRTPIKSESGEFESIMIVWHKITERIKLTREVQKAEEKFRSFINSAQDWIAIKDLEGKYIIVNPVVAKAYHKKPEDFIGKFAYEILPSEMIPVLNSHDEEVLSSKEPKTYNEKVYYDNKEYHFQFVRFPLKDWNGDIIGVCAIGRDITNEIQLQEQLVHSEKLAALGKLAAGVAHEINNPLTGILAFSENLLENKICCGEVKDDINVIIRETLRCRDIVKHLLDFARQDTPMLQKGNINNTILHSLDLVNKLPQFRNITIDKTLSKNIPDLNADLKQIEQVLLNLLINAADAMKYKGNIYIRSIYNAKEKKAVVEIEDTGPGISESLLSHIFEPFFSTKNTSGLGLAVCKGIIERHKGELTAGRGAVGGALFRIIMPAG